MSKITLEPNSSGAGTFSIVSPDSNTNRTLNLPDESGTVATIENTYEDQDALDLFNVTGSAPVYACRAWVQLATNTIVNSGNVSSVIDNGTGFYTINFTNAMPDGNYSVAGSATRDNSASSSSDRNNFSARNYSNSSFNVTFFNTSEFYDPPTSSFSVFR